MNDMAVTPRRQRRRAQPPHPPIVAGDRDLTGTRGAYRDLAAHMRIVSWSRDPVFPEREVHLWETLRLIAYQRDLPVGTRLSSASAQPIGQTYRTGDRKRYRALAAQLGALAEQPVPDFLVREREWWQDIWALGAARGVSTAPTAAQWGSQERAGIRTDS